MSSLARIKLSRRFVSVPLIDKLFARKISPKCFVLGSREPKIDPIHFRSLSGSCSIQFRSVSTSLRFVIILLESSFSDDPAPALTWSSSVVIPLADTAALPLDLPILPLLSCADVHCDLTSDFDCNKAADSAGDEAFGSQRFFVFVEIVPGFISIVDKEIPFPLSARGSFEFPFIVGLSLLTAREASRLDSR